MEDKSNNIQQNSPAQGNTNSNRLHPDPPMMNDSRANAGNNNLQQGVSGHELNPEFGDASDPTSEELGQHHRDE